MAGAGRGPFITRQDAGDAPAVGPDHASNLFDGPRAVLRLKPHGQISLINPGDGNEGPEDIAFGDDPLQITLWVDYRQGRTILCFIMTAAAFSTVASAEMVKRREGITLPTVSLSRR